MLTMTLITAYVYKKKKKNLKIYYSNLIFNQFNYKFNQVGGEIKISQSITKGIEQLT